MRRRGFLRGHAFSECPLKAPSFGTFLGEARKVHTVLLAKGIFSLHLMKSCSIIKEKGVGFMGKLETLKQWVAESSRIVFFGGAGVSTEYRT